MRLLVDNDVIHKLAAYDLLPVALRAFAGDSVEVCVGPRTPFSMCVRKNTVKGERRYGAEVHRRIAAFVGTATVLTASTHLEDFEALAGDESNAIDEGEALLFADASRDRDALVATGDIRSVEALARSRACGTIAQRLTGRVVIVEQLVLAAIGRLGFDETRRRMLPGLAVDMAIHARAFGTGAEAAEVDAVAGLRGRIGDVRKRAPGLIHAREDMSA